jgi:NADH-quinone oxidoreductase subunit B
LILGLAYAWRERSLGMEVKDIKIKGIPHEEFNDNEYLEKYVEELRANGWAS